MSDIVPITMYKALDGNTYSTLKEAEEANQEVKERRKYKYNTQLILDFEKTNFNGRNHGRGEYDCSTFKGRFTKIERHKARSVMYTLINKYPDEVKRLIDEFKR